MGFFLVTQEDKNWILDQKDSSSKTEIASKENFYDALRFRTDLKLNSNKRILFTSIKNIEEFKQKYKQTDMTLDYVIRDRLHTAIFLGRKEISFSPWMVQYSIYRIITLLKNLRIKL